MNYSLASELRYKTKTSISSKRCNSFVQNFKLLFRRTFATGGTRFVQYYRSLRKWCDVSSL